MKSSLPSRACLHLWSRASAWGDRESYATDVVDRLEVPRALLLECISGPLDFWVRQTPVGATGCGAGMHRVI